MGSVPAGSGPSPICLRKSPIYRLMTLVATSTGLPAFANNWPRSETMSLMANWLKLLALPANSKTNHAGSLR